MPTFLKRNANVFVEVNIEVLVWVDPTEPVEPG